MKANSSAAATDNRKLTGPVWLVNVNPTIYRVVFLGGT